MIQRIGGGRIIDHGPRSAHATDGHGGTTDYVPFVTRDVPRRIALPEGTCPRGHAYPPDAPVMKSGRKSCPLCVTEVRTRYMRSRQS